MGCTYEQIWLIEPLFLVDFLLFVVRSRALQCSSVPLIVCVTSTERALGCVCKLVG